MGADELEVSLMLLQRPWRSSGLLSFRSGSPIVWQRPLRPSPRLEHASAQAIYRNESSHEHETEQCGGWLRERLRHEDVVGRQLQFHPDRSHGPKPADEHGQFAPRHCQRPHLCHRAQVAPVVQSVIGPRRARLAIPPALCYPPRHDIRVLRDPLV